MKIEIKTLCLALVCGLASHSAYSKQSECADRNKMGAIYQLEITSMAASSAKPITQQIELWRNGNQVAIHYPQTAITELWQRTANDQLHMVRYFDSYQRGIEYQSIEIKGKHDWSVKRQLISDALKNQMQAGANSGSGCDQTQHFSLNKNHARYDLVWLQQLDLFRELNVKSQESNTNTQWTLKDIVTDAAVVDKTFAELADYRTIDFADIGDAENDPFLRKMMRLGFVEHGNSGFYDADGHDIGSHGH